MITRAEAGRAAATGSLVLVLLASGGPRAWTVQSAPPAFDHGYRTYAALLTAHVEADRVRYRELHSVRHTLDAVVREFGAVTREAEQGWTREQRLAYWINAYNLFTLRAVVDHYPIQGSWFSIYPRNSIRQIDGVWTRLTWRAAGASLTLDQIEHELLRPVFRDARVHFALNCASASCPPLAAEPYTADRLDAQLDRATREFLAGERGLRVQGDRLTVSSIFKWYGDDFVQEFADLVPGERPDQERGILGVIVRYGPPAAAAAARTGTARLGFLDYDWSLNEAKSGSTTD